MGHIQSKNIDRIWSDDYWALFRSHVHRLVAWGYEDAKNKIGSDHEEQEITGFLSEAVQERLRSPNCPRWCNQFTLKEDNPVPGKDRTGKRRKRPDLIFESTSTSRPEYIFEAKRLRKQQKYREEYAARYPEAGMIGYVQCDTPEQWIARLKIAIENDAFYTSVLGPKSLHQNVQVIDVFPNEWVSEHKSHSGKSINIYHILLNCCPENKLTLSYKSIHTEPTE